MNAADSAKFQQLVTEAIVVAEAQGYVVTGPSRRLNGDGSYGLLWQLTKAGKKYQLQTTVVLTNETPESIAVYPNIFKAELANVKEVA